MSHWAEINNNNTVIRVLVGDNNEPDEGQSFVESLGGTWIKTSYNGTIRKNFAGIGMIYDPINDWFYTPQPYQSWTLDSDANWQPPVAYPNNEKFYQWNEDNQQWIEVTNE
jgi:hypothetical protein